MAWSFATPQFAQAWPGNIRTRAKVPRRARYAQVYPSATHALVTEIALREGVSPRLANAVAHVESGHRCGIRGGGIGQVKGATTRSVGVVMHNCRAEATALVRYLKLALARGGPCGGVSLYQAGIFARPCCSGYARKVLSIAGGHA